MQRKHILGYCILFTFILLWISCKHRSNTAGVDIVLHDNPEIPKGEARAIFEKGLRFVEQGDYTNARQCFLKANQESPNVPVILNAIGGTFSQTGTPEQGNGYYEHALKIDSDYLHSYSNYGSSLNTMMQFERAKQILRLGLARPSTDNFGRSALFLNLAKSYFLEKEYDSALIFIDSAKRNSGHGKIYNLALQGQSEIDSLMSLRRQK